MNEIGWFRSTCLSGAVVALAVVTGCESTTSGSQGGAGGTGESSSSSSSSTGGMGGSSGPLWPECSDSVLAVDKILFGDTDPDGTPNVVNGWMQYGFNIDGLVSTKDSTDLCMPADGGSQAAAYPDGLDGIDNSFGKNVMPLMLGLASDFSTLNNEAITKGEMTYLLSLADLGQSACMLPNAFFLGGNLGKAPQFDGSDVWPIDSSSLTNTGDPMSAKCTFPDTKIDMGLVQAGPPSQFDLILNVSGVRMVLPVRHARLSMQLNPDNKSAMGGQIGGIIGREDLAKEIARVAAAFDISFCDPNSPTLQSILTQLRQASDIMLDGSQDPTKECDGISIGLGFTMKPAQLGPVNPPPPPSKDPCAP